LIVVLFGQTAEAIPMPVIGGLMLVIGTEICWLARPTFDW
jgi:hypothetical protein